MSVSLVLRRQEPLRLWIHVLLSPVEYNERYVSHSRLKVPSDKECSTRKSTAQMFATSCQQMHNCVFVFVFSSTPVSFLFPAVNRLYFKVKQRD